MTKKKNPAPPEPDAAPAAPEIVVVTASTSAYGKPHPASTSAYGKA